MFFPKDGFEGKSTGEDYFYDFIKNNLPQKYVSFHNENIGLEETDVILLVPNKGILIIEIKSFLPKNIIEARDNKYIQKTNGDIEYSPFKQAERYRNSLIEKVKKIHPEYAKHVFAYAPCFPYFSSQDLSEKHFDRICELDLFIRDKDLESFSAFSSRIDTIFEFANKIAIPNLKKDVFSYEDIVNVANIISPDCITGELFESSPEIVQVKKDINDRDYSILIVNGNRIENEDDLCDELVKRWISGTKVYFFSSNESLVKKLNEKVAKTIQSFGITLYDEKYDELNMGKMQEPYGFFNFIAEYYPSIREDYEIINGISDEKYNLEELGQKVHFNAEQYRAEHAEPGDMLVNAGAGTGKTYLLVSRIAYLTWLNKYSPEELKERIVLLTFTNDATDEMKARLESYFSKMFYLTYDKTFYEFVECVENMTISTIDSFSKKIVNIFGYYLGMGKDISTTHATLIKQECIRKTINEYIEENKTELVLPSYFVEKIILDLIKKLEDRNKDPEEVQDIFRKTFEIDGKKDIDNDAPIEERVKVEFAKLFIQVPEIMLAIEKRCIAQNQILMGQIITHLGRIESLIENNKVDSLNVANYDYVFIDEFQDTDDQQIKLVADFKRIIGFKLFVVGDVKQSIYRFRGAKDDRAFSYLEKLCGNDSFIPFYLRKNYRTNKQLLDYFDRVFKRLNGKKGLLKYKEKDSLIGINNPEYPLDVANYYFSNEQDREQKIVEVIKEKIITGQKMAILVRNNHQVAEIKRICEANNIYEVDIDTGGSLYRHEAAIDLYKLVYALQNSGNEIALFNLYTTSYVNQTLDKVKLKHSNDKVKFFYENLPESLASWKEYIEKLQVEPILRVVREIIDDVKPWKYYGLRYAENTKENEIAEIRYRNNLDKLFEKISIETNGVYLTLNSFVDFLKIMITTGQEEEERSIADVSKIQCRTVHRAKGKEYDYVFLPYSDSTFERFSSKYNCSFIIGEDGIGYLIPFKDFCIQNDYYQTYCKSDLEDQSFEEARIFYVALTRAKKGVIYLETEKTKKNTTSWSDVLKE